MSRGAAALLIGVLSAALAVASSEDDARVNGFDVRGALVPAERIQRGGPPRDGIPAIDRPRFGSPARAGLEAQDRVLGLFHGGEARAYPVRILNWHEVVNDRFGNDPIAITYCPLCGTGIAFLSRSGARDLVFGVSGLLYNSDVLLYDRATESLWSQIGQQAISGPLKGQRLQAIPLEHTTWADWYARYPGTVVLSTDTGFQRDYDHDPYAGYGRVPQLMFEVERRDARLAPKEWVLGLTVEGVRKAYPLSTLQRIAPPGKAVVEVEDRLAGHRITIRFDQQHQTAQAFDASGSALPALMAYWFAWFAFFPDTEVFGAPR